MHASAYASSIQTVYSLPIVFWPIRVRLINSSMAAIVGYWCGVYAKYLIYVTGLTIVGRIINVARKCRKIAIVLNCLKTQSSNLFFGLKGSICLGIMWPERVSLYTDMVRQKAYETTSTDDLVDYELDSVDTSLKSDTAQQIIQQWIEVWPGDV